jgi:hypothetical protein
MSEIMNRQTIPFDPRSVVTKFNLVNYYLLDLTVFFAAADPCFFSIGGVLNLYLMYSF